MSLFCCTFQVIYIFLTVYSNMTIYDLQGCNSGEVYSVSCGRVHCTGYLYCLNQELKLLYKKKQIPNERIYRAHVECASKWQGMWLCVETSINVKSYNMNGVLYDKWNENLLTYMMETKNKNTNRQVFSHALNHDIHNFQKIMN